MVYVRLERATANEHPHDLGEKIKEIDLNFEKVRNIRQPLYFQELF